MIAWSNLYGNYSVFHSPTPYDGISFSKVHIQRIDKIDVPSLVNDIEFLIDIIQFSQSPRFINTFHHALG